MSLGGWVSLATLVLAGRLSGSGARVQSGSVRTSCLAQLFNPDGLGCRAEGHGSTIGFRQIQWSLLTTRQQHSHCCADSNPTHQSTAFG